MLAKIETLLAIGKQLRGQNTLRARRCLAVGLIISIT
jgi:hypothetical protein